MTQAFLHCITLLESSNIRYVIIGGSAVVLHGVSRFTPDLNVCVDWEEETISYFLRLLKADSMFSLEEEQLTKKIAASKSTGETRDAQASDWLFPVYSDSLAPFRLELMIQSPLPFELLLRNSIRASITQEISTSVCSFDDLLKMKELAGRGQDAVDHMNLRIAQALVTGADLPENDVDPEYVETLREFVHLSTAERFAWLESMLSQYRSLLGG